MRNVAHTGSLRVAPASSSRPSVSGRLGTTLRRRRQSLATALVVLQSARRAYGVHPRECTVCGFAGRFHAYGAPLRFDALCPQCRSVERHRLLALWLAANRPQLTGASVMHVAPEPGMSAMIRPLCGRYTTADAHPGRADRCIDLEHITEADASYDYVICSHVLEHVYDDRRALRELHRIIRPGGAVIVMVPVVEAWPETFEDPGVVDGSERELLFGQADHLRMYGRDIRERITNAGFDLEEFTASEPEVSRHALWRGETIFVARHP